MVERECCYPPHRCLGRGDEWALMVEEWPN